MLKDKYTLFTKEDGVEAITKKLKEDPFIKEVKIYKNHQDGCKVKLTDILGETQTYNVEMTLITPTFGKWIYITELTSTEAEVK